MKISNIDSRRCTDRNHQCKSQRNLRGNLDQKHMKCQKARNSLKSTHESKSVAHRGSKMSIKIKGATSLLLQLLSLSHSEVYALIILVFYDLEFPCKLKGNGAGIWDILKRREWGKETRNAYHGCRKFNVCVVPLILHVRIYSVNCVLVLFALKYPKF